MDDIEALYEPIKPISEVDILEDELGVDLITAAKALLLLRSHLIRIGGVEGTYEGPNNKYLIELKDLFPDDFDLLSSVIKGEDRR